MQLKHKLTAACSSILALVFIEVYRRSGGAAAEPGSEHANRIKKRFNLSKNSNLEQGWVLAAVIPARNTAFQTDQNRLEETAGEEIRFVDSSPELLVQEFWEYRIRALDLYGRITAESELLGTVPGESVTESVTSSV